MDYTLTAKSFAQVATIHLNENEKIIIEPGTAISWDKSIELEGKMNSNGKKGLHGIFSSLGRHFTSGESFFMSYAVAKKQAGNITIAPASIGCIKELTCSEEQQYYLNTGTFLAADNSVTYEMTHQDISNALLGGTGGLFIMKTTGSGKLLISGFGDILEIELTNDELIIDNQHVLAWDTTIDYNIEMASGALGFKTQEGIVDHFKGSGKIFIQTRNIENFATTLPKYLDSSDS